MYTMDVIIVADGLLFVWIMDVCLNPEERDEGGKMRESQEK